MDLPKRLYRSTQNRVLAGVCGGLGEYFNVDPTLIRVAFIIMCFGGGAGVLAYVVLWLVIPERGQEGKPLDERAQAAAEEMKTKAEGVVQDVRKQDRTSGRMIFGVILIALGVMALGNSIIPWHWMRWDIFWALIIVAIGASIIVKHK